MSPVILLGRGDRMVEMPRKQWEEHLSLVPERQKAKLAFMSGEHRILRYFVVRELPRVGAPIDPAFLSEQLHIPHDRVLSVLDDLERNLLFLVRNERGSVSWAFPVTVDRTPHHMAFSTGERLYGA